MENSNSQIVIYKDKNGRVKIDVRFDGDTVWLTLENMAKLFDKAKSTINELWQKIFELTQDEKILGATNGDIKAYTGGGKWIIHVPGLCKISLKVDGAGTETPADAGEPIRGMEDETGFMTGKRSAPVRDEFGESFIRNVARNYAEDDK